MARLLRTPLADAGANTAGEPSLNTASEGAILASTSRGHAGFQTPMVTSREAVPDQRGGTFDSVRTAAGAVIVSPCHGNGGIPPGS
jgi:hypothetical protein